MGRVFCLRYPCREQNSIPPGITNELIKKKLETFPADVVKLAIEAIKKSETGMSEASVTEYLENVVRQIIRMRGAKSDTQ